MTDSFVSTLISHNSEVRHLRIQQIITSREFEGNAFSWIHHAELTGKKMVAFTAKLSFQSCSFKYNSPSTFAPSSDLAPYILTLMIA